MVLLLDMHFKTNIETYVVTLGADNRIRMHILNLQRVKLEEQHSGDGPAPKKERAKYLQTFEFVLEYVYDLEENKNLGNVTNLEPRVKI
jgi:hypothetical protein